MTNQREEFQLFISRIKLARMKRGMRQLDVAVKVGIGETRLSRIETGRETPDPELIAKIAEVLGVSHQEITSEVGGDEYAERED